MAQGATTSVRPSRSRTIGIVYFAYFVTAVLSTQLSGRLKDVGVAVSLLSSAIYVLLTLLLYRLFKPVNASLSLLAALFGLAGCVVTVFDTFRRQPLDVSPLVFFGPYCVLLGFLILRRAFVPKAIGWLLLIAGLGWLAYLAPAVAEHLSTPLKVLGFLAELSLMLWLLVVGV